MSHPNADHVIQSVLTDILLVLGVLFFMGGLFGNSWVSTFSFVMLAGIFFSILWVNK